MAFSSFINPTTIVVYFTIVAGFLFLKKKPIPNRLLLGILTVSSLTELLYVILTTEEGRLLLYSLSFVLHNALWLLLLLLIFQAKKKEYLIFWGFLLFSVFNLFFYEGDGLNYLTFIVGAILYIVYFIYKLVVCLKNEQLDFFSTNDFILISSPVMFFLGFSFNLGFRDSPLRNALIFNEVDLYTFIGNCVNFIYYGLLIIYIFKQKKYA